MRLLVVSHNYPRRSATGAGLFIHRLNRGLQALGVEVHVLQLTDWAPPWPVATLDRSWREAHALRRDMLPELDGIPIHHPATWHPRPSRFFPGDPWDRQVEALVRYVKRRPALARCDAVMGHFMVPDGYHAVRLAEAIGVPSAAMAWGDDVHAWPEERPAWRARLETTLRGLDLRVACSARLARDGASWIAEPSVWEVVYAGTDLTTFRPPSGDEYARGRAHPAFRDVPAGARVALMIAQPVVAKGYLEMLEAWQAVASRHADWHLVMVGSNWGNVDVAAEVARRGLAGRASWAGAHPAADIPVLLRSSDAFVLPSHNEGLSLSMLEAMATALPVVVTEVGGHAEVVVDGESGWLVPAKDVGALAGALDALVSDDAERGRRARAGRAAVERVGSPEDNARRLAEMIGRTIAGGQHR